MTRYYKRKIYFPLTAKIILQPISAPLTVGTTVSISLGSHDSFSFGFWQMKENIMRRKLGKKELIKMKMKNAKNEEKISDNQNFKS